MRLFDVLLGVKRPAPGVVPRSRDAVLGALLALDRDTAPFAVRLAGAAEGGDVIAEWRVFDPRWHAVFAAATLDRSLAIHLRLRDAGHEVRCLHKSRGLAWRSGVPVPLADRGQVRGGYADAAFGIAPAFVESSASGAMQGYRFAPSEVRRPLEAAVTAQGWIFRGVGLSRL